jgi:hypothetical protein
MLMRREEGGVRITVDAATAAVTVQAEITWHPGGRSDASVTIELLQNEQVLQSIARNEENTGRFTWTLPTGQPLGHHRVQGPYQHPARAYRIRVRESMSRTINSKGRVSTQLEIPELLPPDQMGELLCEELEERGFERDGNVS